MNTPSFLLILASLLFTGCHQQSQPATTAELDSLSTLCYTQVQELKTDELRQTANEYLAKAPKGSKAYFEARQFYINSYFNAKDYHHTLTLLNETMEDPALKRLPASYANYRYTEARCYQFSRQYPEAIAVYRQLLDIEPDAKTEATDKELLYKLHVGAMMQTMYSYYFAGKTQEGFEAFGALDRECPPYIAAHYRRDLLAVFSYAAFLANKPDTARVLIDQTLALPPYDDNRENRCRDYNFAAEIYRVKESERQTAIRYFEESLRISQEDQSIPGEQYVMTTLGHLYLQTGEYMKALQLYQTAEEVALRRNDPNAAANVYLALANIYNKYKLTEETLFYTNKALEFASIQNSYDHLGPALKMKATLLIENHADSAFCLLDSAAACFERGELESDWINTQLLKASYLMDTPDPDSLAEGIKILQNLAGKKLSESQRKDYLFYLIRGLDKRGEITEALALCKQIEEQFNSNWSIDSQYDLLKYLIDFYIRQGKANKVMELSRLWHPIVAAKLNEDVTSFVTSAHIKYQTKQKEQQLQLLKAELRIKQLSIVVYITIIFFLLSVIAWGYLWWQQRKKQLRFLFEQLIRRHLEWKELNLLPAGEELILPYEPSFAEKTEVATLEEASPASPQEPNKQQVFLYRHILAVMQKEKPFLDPSFDLNLLARHIGTNRTMLSTTLNRMTGMNFSNWLAEYRVNFLLEQLPQYEDKSITELYPLVGFSSRTSFFRQFRQVTGMTPIQYQAQQNRNNDKHIKQI